MEVLDKIYDNSASVTDVIDGFVSYKLNRYKNKLSVAVRKMRGKVIC